MEGLRHGGGVAVVGRTGAVRVVAGAARDGDRAVGLLRGRRVGLLVRAHGRLAADGADAVAGRGRRLRCKRGGWLGVRTPACACSAKRLRYIHRKNRSASNDERVD